MHSLHNLHSAPRPPPSRRPNRNPLRPSVLSHLRLTLHNSMAGARLPLPRLSRMSPQNGLYRLRPPHPTMRSEPGAESRVSGRDAAEVFGMQRTSGCVEERGGGALEEGGGRAEGVGRDEGLFSGGVGGVV
ncbi:hypothetical protein ACMFMF_006599 [Clarireedia jacksonii]